MTVSILNRVMGVGLATVGTLFFTAWLIALGSGKDAYEMVMGYARGPIGYIFAVGLSFAFFLHLCAGLRHFVMDAGAGFELRANRLWAWGTIAAPVILTAIMWLIILGKAL